MGISASRNRLLNGFVKTKHLINSIVISLMLASCVFDKGYLGPVRLPSELALIKGLIRKKTDVYFNLIDESSKPGFFSAPSEKLYVLPGQHTVEIIFRNESSDRSINRFQCEATFSAEAGHTYQLYASQSHLSPMRAWIKDMKTDTTVGHCEQIHPDVLKKRRK